MKKSRGYRVLLALLLLPATLCTYAIEMKVVFTTSEDVPIEGAQVKYNENNWKPFGYTDENGVAMKDIPVGTYSFMVLYDGQSIVNDFVVTDDQGLNELYFKTVKMKVKLYSSTDVGIGGGIVEYKSPGWKEFGVTKFVSGGGGGGSGGGGSGGSGGSGGGCGGDEGGDEGGCGGDEGGHDPGCPEAGGDEGGDEGGCSGGGGGTGSGTGGGTHKEILPGTYSFRMTYEGQTITWDDVVVTDNPQPLVFHTVKMVVKLRDSNMGGLGGALVEFNSSGWKEFGITKLTVGGGNGGSGGSGGSGGGCGGDEGHDEGGCGGDEGGHDPGCPEGGDEGGDEGGCGGSGGSGGQGGQGGSGGGCGGDEGGCGGSGGSGGNGGGPIGNAHKELLPGSYSFRMNWEGATSTVGNVNIEEESPLLFFTQQAVVKLVDEWGNGIGGGNVRFYSDDWRDGYVTEEGTGEVILELLPKDYLFEMEYEGMTLVKAMGINPNEYTVVFEWEGGELKSSKVEDEILVSDLNIFPNPASDLVNIRFAVEETCHLDVSILDMNGKKVDQLFSGEAAAGNFQLQWHGTNGTGQKVKNGVYLCRIGSGNKVQVKTVLMAR